MSQFIKMGFMLNMHSETNFFYMCFSLILGKVKRCFKWVVIVYFMIFVNFEID